ncbi:MAG: AraC family transcriptional regulator [Bacteroidetes bacterium]|nr:AraC family transcriptional regulator [Bacteroidota bacterium]
MKLETYTPCDALKPFIESYLFQEIKDETSYRVLPGTGLVIGFQYKGKLSRIDEGTERPLAISGVSGLADHSRTFRNSAGIGTILVFFKEGGAVPFFQQPLHELFRESVSLDNFMLRSELLSLEDQLASAKSNPARLVRLEKFLIGRMRVIEPDRLVLAALTLIHQRKGNVVIGELARDLHTSLSPLEKRFRAAIGASPKKFAGIVRLKHLIQQYDPQNSLTELGYQAGFYDQAHFIKEFKAFTGEIPQTFFLKK